VDVVSYIAGFSVGGLLLLGGLLHLAGVKTVIGPWKDLPPAATWANLFLGLGLVLFSVSRILRSHGPWETVFLLPSLVCAIFGAYLYWRSRHAA
jgi:hypothetical protein